jgi:hypothetical protein
MAKKRTAPKAGKQSTEPGPRSTVLTIKGTEEWKEWLNGLSDHLRIPTSTIVDLALVRYAKESGYTKEPPKR